jgi:hypothetical protein
LWKIFNMEKEFVPYELALRMKKLGFVEPCLKAYDKNGMLYHSHKTDKLFTVLNSNLSTQCSAPLYQQAFRWFREKYDLFGYSYPNDYQTYGYRIVEVKSPENKELIYDWGTNNTNEEAELACLEKLIEIIEGVKE